MTGCRGMIRQKRVFHTRFLWVLAFILLAGCSTAKQGGPSPVTTASSYFNRVWKFSGQVGSPRGDQVESEPAETDPETASILAKWEEMDDPLVDQRCLAGRWEAVGLEQVIARSVNRPDAGLHLDGVEGRVVYAFDGKNQMQIRYEDLVASFSGVLDGQEMVVRQFYDGTATAQYQVDLVKNELVLSDFGDEEIFTALEINGQRLVEGGLPVWRVLTSSSGGPDNQASQPIVYSVASLACMGDDMLIQSRQPFPGPVIILYRLPE